MLGGGARSSTEKRKSNTFIRGKASSSLVKRKEEYPSSSLVIPKEKGKRGRVSGGKERAKSAQAGGRKTKGSARSFACASEKPRKEAGSSPLREEKGPMHVPLGLREEEKKRHRAVV